MDVSYSIQILAGQLDRFEISRDAFVEGCARLMVAALGCARAGVWLFDEGEHGPVSRCLGLFDRNRGGMVVLPDAHKAQVGAYFEALEREGYVMADDIDAHPATRGILRHTSNANEIRSLLAAAFTLNGTLFGAFTCSEVGRTRTWTGADLVTLKRIGNRAALALCGASQTRPSTLPMPL